MIVPKNGFHFLSEGAEITFGMRWVFYGPSGSGKTYTAIEVLSLHKRLKEHPIVLLISPNAGSDETWKEATKAWSSIADSDLVDEHYTSLSEDVKSLLSGLIDRRSDDDDDDTEHKPIVLMIDDLGEDHTINMNRINNPIRTLAISARHLKISLMMLYQSVSGTLNVLAKNADVIVAKKITNLNDLKLFHKLYLGSYTPEEFRGICRRSWLEPYDSLVIDRTTPGVTKIFRNFEDEIHVKEEVNFRYLT